MEINLSEESKQVIREAALVDNAGTLVSYSGDLSDDDLFRRVAAISTPDTLAPAERAKRADDLLQEIKKYESFDVEINTRVSRSEVA